jgi:hypothetical protein
MYIFITSLLDLFVLFVEDCTVLGRYSGLALAYYNLVVAASSSAAAHDNRAGEKSLPYNVPWSVGCLSAREHRTASASAMFQLNFLP